MALIYDVEIGKVDRFHIHESNLAQYAPTAPYIVHMRWYSDFRYWEDVPVRLDSQLIRATMAKLARLRVLAHGRGS